MTVPRANHEGANGKRPDIVLYVNGIALGVLELKRSTVSVAEGIRQNLDNQKKIFIEHFFSTIQFVMAGNDTEGFATPRSNEREVLSDVEGMQHRSRTRSTGHFCSSARRSDSWK